jgi:hypothetical protein
LDNVPSKLVFHPFECIFKLKKKLFHQIGPYKFFFVRMTFLQKSENGHNLENRPYLAWPNRPLFHPQTLLRFIQNQAFCQQFLKKQPTAKNKLLKHRWNKSISKEQNLKEECFWILRPQAKWKSTSKKIFGFCNF